MRRLFTALSTCFFIISNCVGVDDHDYTMAGGRLSAGQAQALEAAVKENPEDRSARKKLLGYYFLKGHAPEMRQARLEHIVWFVKNHPQEQIAGFPEASVDPYPDGKSYDEVKKLWLEQVDKQSTNAAVIGNAAAFFVIHDADLALQLLEKAQLLEPQNAKWADHLGHQYALKGTEDKASSAKALVQFEKAQSLDTSEIGRFSRLTYLAKQAFVAGEGPKAFRYATELLETAQKHKEWSYGNAIHDGNCVLGLVALAKSNKNEAIVHLLAAGKTPGSPNLDSFGPNMRLAKELLAKGEKETVLQYFELCRVFWKNPKLDEWKKQIEQGETPDFGPNLVY